MNARTLDDLLPEPERRLVLNVLGPPGSGKGVQSGLLGTRFHIPHISVGDLFRASLFSNGPMGQLLDRHFAATNSDPPPETALGLLASRLSRGDCTKGFVLEGFPRKDEEVDAMLAVFLGPTDRYLPIVLELDSEEAFRRIALRRTCASCQRVTSAHVDQNVCGACGGRFGRRQDDGQESWARRRLADYETAAEGTFIRLARRGLTRLLRIDAAGTVQEVHARIVAELMESVDLAADLSRPR